MPVLKNNEEFKFEFLINGETYLLSDFNTSFSLSDSIYSLYNQATMEISDDMGAMAEVLAFSEGNKIEITFSRYDQLLTGKYVIVDHFLKQVASAGNMAGKYDLNLVSDWADEQEVKNKAHKGRISDIVKKIVGQRFLTKKINDTGNDDYWYQIWEKDSEFLYRTLLPYAYSENADHSPFYMFLNTDGTFNFRNFKDMVQAKPSYEIYSSGHTASEQTLDMFIIQDIRKWTNSSIEKRKYRQRDIFSISREDGSLVEKEDKFTDYPVKKKSIFPIIVGSGGSLNKSGTQNLGFELAETTGQKENQKGLVVNEVRESLMTERYLIILGYNPFMKSGDVVRVHLQYKMEKEVQSETLTDDFLIENCEHVWIAEDKRAFTKIIVGRRTVPFEKRLKTLQEKLLQG